MPPFKRRRKAKTPIPAKPHNPFHRALTVAAGFLVLAISIPMFIGVVHGQSPADSPLGTQTAALISALGTLGQQIGDLKKDIQSLRATLVDYGQDRAASGGETYAAGIPECLNACRVNLSSCLASSPTPTGPIAGAPLIFFRIGPGIVSSPASAALPPLDSCRVQANDCMNRCRPQPAPTISCEDRCAVALGGCLDAAGTDSAKLLDCRTQNRRCLLAACRQGSADSASLESVPSAVCREQCARDLKLCRNVAKFDEKQLEACEAISKRCLELVCAPEAIPGERVSSAPPAAPGQEKTIACENACTETHQSCRVAAGNDQTALSKCDSAFGSCREACLIS